MKILSVIVAVFLLATAFFQNQFLTEYQTIFQWIITIIAIVLALDCYASKNILWLVVFIAIALLYNPLVPVSIGHQKAVNIVTAIIFLLPYIGFSKK